MRNALTSGALLAYDCAVCPVCDAVHRTDVRAVMCGECAGGATDEERLSRTRETRPQDLLA